MCIAREGAISIECIARLWIKKISTDFARSYRAGL